MREDDEAAEKISADDLRDEMIGCIRATVRYWATLPDFDGATGRTLTVADRCDGVAFSILTMLDGVGSMPCAFDLVARQHPEDDPQEYEGVTLSYMLHDHYYQRPAPAEGADE